MVYEVAQESTLCHFGEVQSVYMICELCRERSDRIIRVASWQVCQWCVSNNVLEHALEVESEIVKLRIAIAKTKATHERDIQNEAAAKAKLELAYAAYADLTTAMRELAASKNDSLASLRQATVATKALENYADKERHKSRRARQHA